MSGLSFQSCEKGQSGPFVHVPLMKYLLEEEVVYACVLCVWRLRVCVCAYVCGVCVFVCVLMCCVCGVCVFVCVFACCVYVRGVYACVVCTCMCV